MAGSFLRLRRAALVSPPGRREAHSWEAAQLRSEYDAVIIGGGHNGLIAAAYLQKSGVSTAVLERRHVIGGAAVTEEIFPGFKFSRASYVLSLLRPQVYKELELKKHGLKIYLRNPHSFTPILEEGSLGRPPRSLTLSQDPAENREQIGQFSKRDAKAYADYETLMDQLATAVEPLLDTPPVDVAGLSSQSLLQRLRSLKTLRPLLQTGMKLGRNIPHFYELLTAPTTKVLDRWFESEPLKATLAMDAVIGAMLSPNTPGSGYVLLHHVMGELEGKKGAWGFVEGGMGSVSMSIARAAASHGAAIFTEKVVERILLSPGGTAGGVVLQDGTEVKSKVVLSNATPWVTFCHLTPQVPVRQTPMSPMQGFHISLPFLPSAVAVDRLPNFLAAPNLKDGKPLPHHQCTVHLNCEESAYIHEAYQDACRGIPSRRPMLEMCIPSAVDPTLAPPGCHVISIFSQYTPYTLAGGHSWDEHEKNAYADQVFDTIEAYAPGFKASVIGRDILTPPDLERIFGLTGGNIFHGAMLPDQLYLARPLPSFSNYRSPIQGLYICGSGAHPGGGVMGSAGRNAALVALGDLRRS
nr:PREDICTED: pyridine nucleotide-disulfide oxidoreductase domain-containing protein 2 [Latimeria chalumnae]|eukprot:XP_014346389.1 PREDICTED: pyridine nucleotide-disulfide oxidoreductase domain-containing protein 2 [Latimeria chalumnae]